MTDISWKKIPGGERYHDQWNAVGVEAMIRESGGWYDAFIDGKRIAGFMNLSLAKKAVARKLEDRREH